MSVIIKGMEMPKNCGECPFIFTSWGIEYYCHLAESSTSAEYVGREKMTNCPLIELPPHGRLIDADELIRELASEHVGGLEAIKKYTNADTWTSGLHTAWRLIDDASTIIEAEGETDGR